MLELPDDFVALVRFNPQSGEVISREGKRLEFKASFNPADFSQYTKVLASFANAMGGVIVFGVSDKPRTIAGTDEPIDEAKWADRLRDEFDPEIPFAIKTYDVGTSKVFVVGVDASFHKPIICKKSRSKQVPDKKGGTRDIEVLREGAIYFRYAGQTRAIGFSDLHTMLVEREQRYLRTVMETLQVIQKVGVENAGVVDASSSKSSVYMSKETAKGLSFIDKGKLVQESGAPAYVVMGNIDLHQIVHAPLEEEDKNIPTEAAKMLSPVVKEIYGIERISPQQVTLLLRKLRIDGDNLHSVHEKKMGRKYVTRAGITAVADFIRAHPDEAIGAFGSKAAKLQYGLRKAKTSGGIQMPAAEEPSDAAPSLADKPRVNLKPAS